MAYVALYRKWRPDNFKNLVGQEHISHTLSNAIITGRVGHAYLFSGPRGTGKTSTAKILAKSLNCDKGPTLEPCGECENCRKIADGTSMDVYEIDAASNRGIDEIRGLRETVQYAPVLGRYKVYIIDEVHMLTTEAFNALLKTLEEPPAHVVFILATTESHKVPATIQSRCQRYDFKRITVDNILGRLKLVAEDMQLNYEPEALRLIAMRAEGGMRDALSIMDQCAALSDGSLTEERVKQLLGLIGSDWISKLAAALCNRDSNLVLDMVAELLHDGKDLQQLLAELSNHFRSLMIYQATKSLEAAGFFKESEIVVINQSKQLTKNQIMSVIRRLHEAMNEVKWSPQPRISVEAVLLEICQGNLNSKNSAGSFKIEHDNNAAAAAIPVSDGRIEQLEVKINQLMAMVEQLKANPLPAAAETEAAEEGITSKSPAQSKAFNLANKIEEKEETTQIEYSEEGKKLWDNVMADVSGPMHSSLIMATFLGVDGDNFHLGFANIFYYDRAKNVSAPQIEKLLKKHSGRKLHLICHLNESLPNREVKPAWARKNDTVKKKEAEQVVLPKPEKNVIEPHHDIEVNIDELKPQEQKSLQNAVEFLGGHFVKMDDDKKPKPLPTVVVENNSSEREISSEFTDDDAPFIEEDFGDISSTGYNPFEVNDKIPDNDYFSNQPPSAPPPDDDDYVLSQEYDNF